MSLKKKSQIPYMKVVPELTNYGFVVTPLIGKKPILKRWNTLTQTPDKLYVFEGYNIGISTGRWSGITVLDIDIKQDGMKLWKSISMAYPEFTTPTVRTPTGGLHMYFRYNKHLPSFSTFKLRDRSVGWDLLNNDRLVVAPPSINIKTHQTYKWVVSPKAAKISVMPKWLEHYLLNVKVI